MNEYIKIPNIFNRYTDGPNKNKLIEGEASTPEIDYLCNAEWIWSEKVDGTNTRILWDGYRVSFMGRTEKSQIPQDLQQKLDEMFGGEAREEVFERVFGDKTVIWDNDFSYEDYGFDSDGLIHECHCTNCGARITYMIPFNEEEED